MANSDDEWELRVLTKRMSMEYFKPTFTSPLRKTSLNVATFNLVASTVGGGILSLPMAFDKSGLVLATLMSIFAAMITEFGNYILCSCARRTGSATYMEVVNHAFGAGAEICMTISFLAFLMGFLVAYYVLLMGILAPIVRDIIANYFTSLHLPFDIDGEYFEPGVLMFALLLVSPLMMSRNLYALRHICYVGFSSVCVIVVSVGIRAFQKNFNTADGEEITRPEIKLFTTDFSDILLAFPIIVLSYQNIFNVPEVQANLMDPTRSRVRYVLRASNVISFSLYQAFGLVGYFYAYDSCKANIFLNFDASDPLVIIGRLGMGITLMFAVPLVILPTRETFFSISPQIKRWLKKRKDPVKNSELERLITSNHLHDTAHSFASDSTFNLDIEHNNSEESSSKSSTDSLEAEHSSIVHYLVTLLLASLIYAAAVAVPNVAFVWAIMGSTLAFGIGFILPAACYLKIRGKKGATRTNVGAFILLVITTIFAIVCTAQTIRNLEK